MRLLFVLVCLSSVCFGQNKKSIIASLSRKIDSLTLVLNEELEKNLLEINLKNKQIEEAKQKNRILNDTLKKTKTKNDSLRVLLVDSETRAGEQIEKLKDSILSLLVLAQSPKKTSLPTFFLESPYAKDPIDVQLVSKWESYDFYKRFEGLGEAEMVWVDFEVIKSTSQLKHTSDSGDGISGDEYYGFKKLTDGDPRTAWVEGVSGSGIGEGFIVDNSAFFESYLEIYNGYQKNPKTWKENSRVKKLKLYANDIPLCFIELEDVMGPQALDLREVGIGVDESGEMVFGYPFFKSLLEKDFSEPVFFEIVEIYKGTKYSDVCISEISAFGG